MSKSFGNIIRASILCYYYRDIPPYIKYKHPIVLYMIRIWYYDVMIVVSINMKTSVAPTHMYSSDITMIRADVTNGKNNNILDESLQSGLMETTTTAIHDICTLDWLWQFRGKLVVIATPYRPGYHYAQRPTDFIPIIEHLQYLHNDHDIVHGDIRASNMVFSTTNCRHRKMHQVPASPFPGLNDRVNNQIATKRTAKKSTKTEVLSKMACTVMTTIKSSAMTTIKDVLSTRTTWMRPMSSIEIPIDITTLINANKNITDTPQACLIDFDFGGLHGTSTTRYPTGYNRFVYDGHRIGQEHEMIQYNDDWHALFMVIFQVHAYLP